LLEDWYAGLREDDKKLFSIIKRNTRYMNDLLGELSDCDQSDSDASALCCADVNIADFCREIADSERKLADQKSIRLKFKINNRLYDTVRFDPVKIRRVLDNLLTNAFKFSNCGREVQLRIECKADRIEFEVIDQGQGIPEDEIPLLFKEFGITSTRPTGGENSTGLGLAIARKIVEMHGGSISVNSTFGWGSKFSFWIPRILHS
jgi:signal transduction histidine kinase